MAARLARVSPLVTGEWLAAHLTRVRLLDATWHFPTLGKNATEEFSSCHIPGANRLDIDSLDDSRSGLQHMLPSCERFEAEMKQLGIANEDHVVVYDCTAIGCAAPRAYWMFKAMGHDDVSILDGGLASWLRSSGPVVAGATEQQSAETTRAPLIADAEAVLQASTIPASERSTRIVDARSPGRVTALGEDEPWRPVYPHVRRGRIPHSFNVPSVSLLTAEGTFRSAEEIRAAFEAAGVSLEDPDREIITSCGSGVTAAVLYVALELAGHRNVRLYDGSWCEWGNRLDLPVEQGPLTGTK